MSNRPLYPALDQFAEPALVIDEYFEIVAANPAAESFRPFIAQHTRYLHKVLIQTLAANTVTKERYRDENDARFDLSFTFVPLNSESALILIVDDQEASALKDELLQTKRALVEEMRIEKTLSSQLSALERFRDMSADLVWETDQRGILCAFSRPGSVDSGVVGQPFDAIFDAGGPSFADLRNAGSDAFEQELTMRDAAQQPILLRGVVCKIIDAEGNCVGLMGAATDISREVARAEQVDRLQRKAAGLVRLMRLLRDAAEPGQLLERAVAVIEETMAADGCAIFEALDNGSFINRGKSGDVFSGLDSAFLRLSAIEGVIQVDSFGKLLMAAPSSFHGERNGLVIVWRSNRSPLWSQHDREMLDEVVVTVGIAIEQRRRSLELINEALVDGLTGLANRKGLLARARDLVELSRSLQRWSAVIFVDIDGLKAVNDSMGTASGDELLRLAADFLRSSMRRNDLCARLGGDEFLVLLFDISEEAARAKLARILGETELFRPFRTRTDRPLGFSAGLAMADPRGQKTLHELITAADQEMYRSKLEKKRLR